MSERIVLIGGGEHARVVAEAVRCMRPTRELLGFVDPEPCEETVRRLGLRRLGCDAALAEHPEALGVLGFSAIGGTACRRAAVARASSYLAGWAIVVHAAAVVSPTATLAPGTVVMAGAVVQTGARLGAHCVVNTRAVVEHDVALGDHAQVAPGATLGGGVVVGEGAYIGLGAAVRDHVCIGAGALVGMGAVVVRNVSKNSRVMGVPAR